MPHRPIHASAVCVLPTVYRRAMYAFIVYGGKKLKTASGK